MSKNITEMTILITAAASGIGSVMASELAAKGATIIICDCDKERLKIFSEQNPGVHAYETDIQDEQVSEEIISLDKE